MSIEAVLVFGYLLACIGIGVYFSRKSLNSESDYWVAGRSIGVGANAMAIMASLASGGSIIGVMGLAYRNGIPFTLALFAGAILGFPLAAVLVAAPLRRLESITISDFFNFRYPHPVVRWCVPLFILFSFTIYIIAQMKAAGITAQVLLGMDYRTAVTGAALVFISYVSLGGMLAVTWTDIIQGTLMLIVVLGTAIALSLQYGAPLAILDSATTAAPALGQMTSTPVVSLLGIFVLWAAAIPVIPHIVMRVFTAKDARGARISLNLAMILYSVMILSAVMIIAPVGMLLHPGLKDADHVFLKVMQGQFPPVVRGFAISAVMAAVMSTTDALLLACSAAVTHDLLGPALAKMGEGARKKATLIVPWVIGLFAMVCAYDPPELITTFYSAAIGLLSASLFVPLIAGLWWKKANTAGGASSIAVGAGVYLALFLGVIEVPKFTPVLFALAASAGAMVLGACLGGPSSQEVHSKIKTLHSF